jgi:hypothetical protein
MMGVSFFQKYPGFLERWAEIEGRGSAKPCEKAGGIASLSEHDFEDL